jgi:hypothetical protein
LCHPSRPLGSAGISCGYRHAGGKKGDALCSCRRRSNNLDAFHWEKGTHLLKADLGVSRRDAFGYALASIFTTLPLTRSPIPNF